MIQTLVNALTNTKRLSDYTAFKERKFFNNQLSVYKKIASSMMPSQPPVLVESSITLSQFSSVVQRWQSQLVALSTPSRWGFKKPGIALTVTQQWPNESACAVARQNAFASANAQGKRSYLGRLSRQSKTVLRQDKHLYYRSLEFALDRCKSALSFDNAAEQKASFEHLARLTQEGLTLFPASSSLGAMFKAIAADLQTQLIIRATGSWLTIIPTMKRRYKSEQALAILQQQLDRILEIISTLARDELLTTSLKALKREEKPAYDYLCSLGTTLETPANALSYHTVNSACEEINAQYEVVKVMRQRHDYLRQQYQQIATLQATQVQKHPISLQFFSVKNKHYLVQEQIAINDLLNAMQVTLNENPLTEILLISLENQLSVIAARQTAYAIFYNDAQEFLLENTPANKQAAEILGFDYELFCRIYRSGSLSSSTFKQSFTTRTLKDTYRKNILKYSPDKNVNNPPPPYGFIRLATFPLVEEDPAPAFEHPSFTEKVAYVRQSQNLFYAIKPGILIKMGKGEHAIHLSSSDLLTSEDNAKLLAHHQNAYWQTCFSAIQNSYEHLKQERYGIVQWLPCAEYETPVIIAPGQNVIHFNRSVEIEVDGEERLRAIEEKSQQEMAKVRAEAEEKIRASEERNQQEIAKMREEVKKDREVMSAEILAQVMASINLSTLSTAMPFKPSPPATQTQPVTAFQNNIVAFTTVTPLQDAIPLREEDSCQAAKK